MTIKVNRSNEYQEKTKEKSAINSFRSDLFRNENIFNWLRFSGITQRFNVGSRVSFICEEDKILFHKPHGKDPMKKGTIRKIIEALQTYKRL